MASEPGVRDGVRGEPIPQGIMERVKAGIRAGLETFRGKDVWMGPGEPIKPTVDVDAVPRIFPYVPGYNIARSPRSEEAISFQQLRGLANSYDILRLAIEKLKNKMESLDWTFRPKRRRDETEQQAADRADDPRIDELNEFFRYPDKTHDWKTWLRQLLEEMLVIDAVSIYRRPALAGNPFALEIIDGSTVKPNLDEFGRIASYEQWLYGIRAVDFALPGTNDQDTPEELLYAPRNPRPSKVYGYSPVEQIIITVNIALRRQQTQLGFYTDGNIPEGFMEAPQSWDSAAIEAFWKKWDAYLSGNNKARAKILMLPFGAKPTFPKVELIKTEMDDWLASLVCFCLGVSRTELIKPMNRASSQTGKEQAIEDGVLPLMSFVANGIMTPMVEKWWGYDDLEFTFELHEDVDRETQATVNKTYISTGVLSINEVREQLGKEAIEGGDTYVFVTAAGVQPVPGQGVDASEFAMPSAPQPDGGAEPDAGGGGKKPVPQVGKAAQGKKNFYARTRVTPPRTSSPA